MAALKGFPRNQSQYDTHNWCSHCEKWLADKPTRCPECNKFARHSVRRVRGRYSPRDVFRY